MKPEPFVSALPLIGEFVFSIGPFEGDPVDDSPKTVDWLPNRPYPIRIQLAQLWIGVDRHGSVDTYASMRVIEAGNVPGSVIAHVPWDCYSDSRPPGGVVTNFAPNYVEVPAGGGVRLSYVCVPPPGLKTRAHIHGLVWYLEN